MPDINVTRREDGSSACKYGVLADVYATAEVSALTRVKTPVAGSMMAS
jgi:Flp pilus assembly pilin Flp